MPTLLAFVITLFCPSWAHAANQNRTLNVVDYGATGNDRSDDIEAFNNALLEAHKTTGILTVNVPKGTYYISSDIHIFSDTTLNLASGTTIISTNPEGRMLTSMHLTENGKLCNNLATCTHGAYTQVHNVTVKGGTWNRNDPRGTGDNGIMRISHGHDIVVSDMVVMGCTNHFINLSGSKYVTVKNVTFKNAVRYTVDNRDFWGDYAFNDSQRLFYVEALHLDYIAEKSEYGFPFDDTGCQYVVVEDCIFDNVFAGIGTHHEGKKDREVGFEVRNCTFKNLFGPCINGSDYQEVLIEHNEVNKAGYFFYANGTSTQASNNLGNLIVDTHDGSIPHYDVQIKDNTITDVGTNAIFISGTKRSLISNNTITRSELVGIRIVGNAAVQVTGNIIKNAGDQGITVAGDANSIVENNTITSAVENGIYVSDNATALVRNNTVTDSKDAGIRITGNSCVVALDNIVKSSGSQGISVAGNSIGTYLEGNTITAAKANGIHITGSALVKARNNTISNVSVSGIQVNGESAARILNNMISGYTNYGIACGEQASMVADANTIEGGIYAIMINSSGTKSIVIDNAISGTSKHGVYAGKGSHVVFELNTISDTGSIGICANEDAHIECISNEITSTVSHGIFLGGSAVGVLEANVISNTGEHGIYTSTSEAAYIERNQVLYPAKSGICVGGSGFASIAGNESSNAGQYGITVGAGAASNIASNTVSNSISHGIYVKQASQLNVAYNTVVDARESGIWINSVAGATVSDNTVSGSGNIGIVFAGASGLPCSGIIAGNTVSGSSGAHDIRLNNAFITNTVIADNILSKGFFANASAQYEMHEGRTRTSITNATASNLGSYEFSYTSLRPDFTLSYNGNTLTWHKDYFCAWFNNFNAGEATLTIYGVGDYYGKLELPYTISEVPVSKTTTYDVQDIFYTGTDIVPEPFVLYHGIWLRPDTDYTVSHTSNIEAGTGSISLSGLGNFSPSSLLNFEIKKVHIASADFVVNEQPGVTKPHFSSVTYRGMQLQEGVHYKIDEWSGNTLPGTGYIVVSAIGANYTGTTRVPFSITNISLAGAKVYVDAQAYDGTAKTPAPRVVMANRTFSSDDYVVSYKNNVNPGTATITITGRGDYTGTITATFSILKTPWKRIWGTTALNTMRAIVRDSFTSAKTVVIATSANYKDALSAAALAGANDAPILLTPHNALASQTKGEITRLKAKKAIIVGGPSAVSESVANQIRALGVTVERVYGRNAPDTSREATKKVGNVKGGTSTVIIATPKDFADALSAAPWAYAFKAPIILTENSRELSQDSINLIKQLKFKRAIIMGGTSAVKNTVEAQLKKAGCTTVQRIAGASAVGTSSEFALWTLKNGFSIANIGVATRKSYKDALTGAAMMGRLKGPILLVNGENRNAVNNLIRGKMSQVKAAYVFGGESAISADNWQYFLKLK